MTTPEKEKTNDKIEEIRPNRVLRASENVIPKDLLLVTCTPRETPPRYVKDTVQLITDIDPKAVNPTIIVFDGKHHKAKAQIFGGCIRNSLLGIGMSFQFCINESNNESTIFILPVDYETNSQ